MNHIKKYAIKRGIESLELVTPRDGTLKSDQRKHFYKKHGFKEQGPGMILEVCPDLIPGSLD